MDSPKQTMYTCTVRILLDPRMCNASDAGACDWMSETLRNLEEHGLVDWGYVDQPTPVYVPLPYSEGDFL